MADTPSLKLPLVAPSQAQKHVTVNEALARIDAALQLSVVSRVENSPPTLTEEGAVYLVPPGGGTNAWDGHGGELAFFVNGGWAFLEPLAGWRLYVADEAAYLSFDGVVWQENILSMGPSGAGMRAETVETDVVLDAGADQLTGFVIPSGAVVYGVTGRVTDAITGTLTEWSLGVDGFEDRYGSGLGLGAGSWLRGLTGQPVTYYSATQLKLSATGGDFASGTIKLAVHLMRFELPRA
ncbi:uncharacterized protein DUF2793 [Litoreibacter ponti]|uniref:Uncharacterized protein DUF2793 n=1 Tax=Litoreibacter ponti TaxID=1510457 RepID=A0A2T6BJK8_9RHOB|nr:DUF2793 domain-containing protein [Litoreibacter ponti]PTX56234.1 uncharacterized protein DUF2793 [Litoreibacter ponti]